MKHGYTSSDRLSGGAAVEQVEQIEAALGVRLPDDVRQHFTIVENISLEGIRLELVLHVT